MQSASDTECGGDPLDGAPGRVATAYRSRLVRQRARLAGRLIGRSALDYEPFADDVLCVVEGIIEVRAVLAAERSAVLVSIVAGLPARVDQFPRDRVACSRMLCLGYR